MPQDPPAPEKDPIQVFYDSSDYLQRAFLGHGNLLPCEKSFLHDLAVTIQDTHAFHS